MSHLRLELLMENLEFRLQVWSPQVTTPLPKLEHLKENDFRFDTRHHHLKLEFLMANTTKTSLCTLA